MYHRVHLNDLLELLNGKLGTLLQQCLNMQNVYI